MCVEALEHAVVEEDDKDFNLTVFYGADADVDVVATTARQYPMMSPLRLVLLKEAQTLERAKTVLEKLAPYIQKPSATTVLAVVYKGDNLAATSAIMKAAAANGDAVVFKSPKLRDYQLAGPVKDYCASCKIGIDDKALQLIVEHVGSDLSKLFGEIDKLIVAAGGSVNRINCELIERNIGISKDFNNFELTSALAVRDYAKAMKIVNYFRLNPKNNPTVVTTGVVYAFFAKLVVSATARDRSDSALMAAIDAKSAYSLREIRAALQCYTPAQAVKAISAIREFDAKSKGIDSMGNEYDLLQEMVFKIITQP